MSEIERIESTAIFKSFVIRIGFKSFEEYMKLFGDNLLKRKIATEWCKETYPELNLSN